MAVFLPAALATWCALWALDGVLPPAAAFLLTVLVIDLPLVALGMAAAFRWSSGSTG